MFDTISVGSATLDLFLSSQHFAVSSLNDAEVLSLPYGGKIDVDSFFMQSGGGATNTAVGFSRLGLRAAVVAELGTDLASQAILAELDSEGVATEFLVREASEQTAVSALLIGKSGDRTAVTARGAAKLLTTSDIPWQKIQTNWLHISSLGNMELVTALAAHCKKQRIRFSWNPGGAELSALKSGQILLTDVYPNVFFVNAQEADQVTEAGYDLELAGQTVYVTDGPKGGKYYEHGQWQFFAPHPTKEVVQLTGAGDAFATGVIAATLHDRLTPVAVEWGKKNAVSVIAHMGAKTGLLRQID